MTNKQNIIHTIKCGAKELLLEFVSDLNALHNQEKRVVDILIYCKENKMEESADEFEKIWWNVRKSHRETIENIGNLIKIIEINTKEGKENDK